MTPLSFTRLRERGAALGEWIKAGGDVDRLAELDRRVRHGRCTDFPNRRPGAETRDEEGVR